MSYNGQAYLEHEKQLHDEHQQSPKRTGSPSTITPTWYAAQIELQKVIDSMTTEEWQDEMKQEQNQFKNENY
jgi:hypothetical protein